MIVTRKAITTMQHYNAGGVTKAPEINGDLVTESGKRYALRDLV